MRDFDRLAYFTAFLMLVAAGTGLYWLIQRRGQSNRDADEILDETSEQSFPASDPPAWTARRGR